MYIEKFLAAATFESLWAVSFETGKNLDCTLVYFWKFVSRFFWDRGKKLRVYFGLLLKVCESFLLRQEKIDNQTNTVDEK